MTGIPSKPDKSPRPASIQSHRSATSDKSGHSVISNTAIAQDSIARDLQDDEIRDLITASEPPQEGTTKHGFHRRPSRTTGVPHPFLGLEPTHPQYVTPGDRENAIEDERALLEDNDIIPPRPGRRKGSKASSARPDRRSSFLNTIRQRRPEDEETGSANGPDETTALLRAPNDELSPDLPDLVDQKWEDAVLSGEVKTTWQRETKVLLSYSAPVMLSFFLQQSLTLTSVLTVGHLGKSELGGASLGGMTAGITGHAIYIGLTLSLDTLCAQAYGSGRKELVGLYLQRMVIFTWLCTIPIGIFWFFASEILKRIVPDQAVAVLAGQYLKILVIGAPAYACFESSKRYVQAQGKFVAVTYVLAVAAPANVFMHWLFVWRLQWGFIGCPIAVVITEWLTVILLFLYVYFIAGLECWPGFTKKAFTNWGPMIRLALPGLVSIIAEFSAIEILTLMAAEISTNHLDANAVLQSLCFIAYGLPLPVSIAGSTRVANLIGATLPDAAKVTTRVMFVYGAIIGVFNTVMMAALRHKIPWLFTNEPDVVELAAAVLPVTAAFQLFDALAAQCNGVLRGIGRQNIAGWTSFIAWYLIALPVSIGFAFGLKWDLYGLWAGPAVGLLAQSALEAFFIWKTSWQNASDEAAERNAAD